MLPCLLSLGADAARTKRPREDAPTDDMDTEQPDQSPAATPAPAGSPASKAARTGAPADQPAAAGTSSQPAGQQQQQQAGSAGHVMLFVYEKEDLLKLHDVVEVVGVLSVVPQLALQECEEGGMEEDGAHPPTSQVGRGSRKHMGRTAWRRHA